MAPRTIARSSDDDERDPLALGEEQLEVVVADEEAGEAGRSDAEQHESGERHEAVARKQYEHGTERAGDRGDVCGIHRAETYALLLNSAVLEGLRVPNTMNGHVARRRWTPRCSVLGCVHINLIWTRPASLPRDVQHPPRDGRPSC